MNALRSYDQNLDVDFPLNQFDDVSFNEARILLSVKEKYKNVFFDYTVPERA